MSDHQKEKIQDFISNSNKPPALQDFQVKKIEKNNQNNKDKVRPEEAPKLIQTQHYFGPNVNQKEDEEEAYEDSDQESQDDNQKTSENVDPQEDYDYETYKNRRLNSGLPQKLTRKFKKKEKAKDIHDESEEEDEEYVDPQVLMRDPYLADLVQNKQSTENSKKVSQGFTSKISAETMKNNENKLDSLPIHYELVLKGHHKAITSISIDQPGSRLCSGSYDYYTRLWDFYGMDKNMQSFRVIEPVEGHPIYQTSWSKDGKHVLIVAGDPQACMLDREGKRILDTHRGDMYIRDILKTNGHTSSINAGQFHPDYNNMFLTCSDDGTVRLWDINQKLYGIAQHLGNKDVVKCLDEKGIKLPVCNLGVRSGSNMCITSTDDGALYVFQLQGSTLGIRQRPEIIIRDAHKKPASTIKILQDMNYVITNSIDDSIKIWDLRYPKHYVLVKYFSSNKAPATKFDLNQTESLLVMPNHNFSTGERLESDTELIFYNTKDLSEYARAPLFDTAVSDIVWHPVLNQIFVGGTDGDIRALFHHKFSKKGSLICISKKEKYWHPENIELERDVILPNDLKIREGLYKNKVPIIEQIKFENPPKKIPKPEMPQNGPGKGGKISGASTVTQYLIRTQNQAPERQDVREQLIKLDPLTKKNPQYVSPAYRETQPNAIYDTTTPEVEANALLSQLKKICPHCGLKICACNRKIV